MYSRLDPIFKTRFRHAETLDTRQGIRRHEEQDERRKKEKKKRRSSDASLWEDHTSVSVNALRGFLQQLLNDSEKKEPDQAKGNENLDISRETQETKPEKDNVKNPAIAERSSRAARAYERAYRATHTEPQQATPPSSLTPSIDLKPEEIRIIHALIDDLGQLAKQGTEQLTLQKSDSFLQSLVDAVHFVKK